MVPQIDEACAPTDDAMNPLKLEGLRAVLQEVPDTSMSDFVQDVSSAIEGSLDAELNTSQHVVSRIGSLCSSDAEPGVLAKDLGVGHRRGFGDNLQEMGLPLRV
jgi:hypothetical protein